MKLTVMGCVVAEGTEAELAIYTAVLLDVIRQMQNHMSEEKARKEASALARALGLSFEEMMKTETEEKKDE